MADQATFPLIDEPPWPHHDGRPVVFLLDASSPLERRLLLGWIDRHQPDDLAPGEVEHASLPRSRRRPQGEASVDPRLQMIMLEEEGYDPLLVPVRVVWMAPERAGVRAVRPIDLLKLGDPRDPDWLRQHWILRRHPDRCRIVAGEPATASDLRARWRERTLPGAPDDAGLPAFVTVQAGLALERAERTLRGDRYKVPKFVQQDLLSRRAFKVGLHRLAQETRWPAERVPRKAVKYLREIAATHSPYVIDLLAHFTRFLIDKSYGGRVEYDRKHLAEVYALCEQYPLVFLPTHKSYIDTLMLRYVLYENDYPQNHTAGGINMNFFPIGPFVRRAGVFFIRRSFRDNPVYKFVLRQYLRYLLEKSFPLEWYIEGGRSRSGKLREPRFGLLGYVVESYEAGAAEDVMLVPVSIAYDQIQEVGDYVAEQRLGRKRGENFRRLVEYMRALRRPHGGVYLRIGEPVSVAEMARPPHPTTTKEERALAVQKIAFEVCARINDVTPITPISLVTLALLGSPERALTAAETAEAIRPYLEFVVARGLPTTEPLRLDTPAQVTEVLDHLVEHRVVSRYDAGPDVVYAVGRGQDLAAAYYRNTIIHFFVETAVCDLALLAAADSADPETGLWEAADRLRDLLKFEFFFPRRAAYHNRLVELLELRDPAWRASLSDGEARRVLRESPLLTAHWVLRPFLEAYRVVAEALLELDAEEPFEEKPFLRSALALGRQYLLQRRLESPESVSAELFRTALRLADNRGLLEALDTAEARKQFAAEISDVLDDIYVVEAVAAARRAGVAD